MTMRTHESNPAQHPSFPGFTPDAEALSHFVDSLNSSWTEQTHNAHNIFQDQHRCRKRADNRHYVKLR